MAKQIEIRLSAVDVLHTHPQLKELKGTVRESELNLLTNCFELQAKREKDYRNVNLCIDCAEQARAITDDMLSIPLTKQDLDLLKKGFDATAEQRPLGWLYCRALLAQLESPGETENED